MAVSAEFKQLYNLMKLKAVLCISVLATALTTVAEAGSATWTSIPEAATGIPPPTGRQ